MIKFYFIRLVNIELYTWNIFFYHDSAACILKDGDIIAAAQEERFTRKSMTFPSKIKYCLNEAGINASDLHIIAFYDKPFLKFERILKLILLLHL